MTGEFSFPEYEFSPSYLELLGEIPIGSILYTIHALSAPEGLGGTWLEIGKLKLKSKLVTSYYGDRRMHFAHYRHDDDFQFKPEWAPYAFPFIPDSDRDFIFRPKKETIE